MLPFGFFWAFAILMHQGCAGRLFELSFDTFLNCAVLALLLRPSSPWRLLVVSAAELCTFAYHLPFETNHSWLFAFSNAAILGTCLAELVRQKPQGFSTERWVAAFAPTLRLHLLLLYLFVTLAKLNRGFFDPSVSCAQTMHGWLTHKLPFLPATGGAVSITGVLLTEGALPVLLLVRRTRQWALTFGTLFHMVLGINGFYNFSAAVLGLYALFVSPAEWTALAAFVSTQPRLPAFVRRLARIGEARWSLPAIIGLGLVVMVAGQVALPDHLARARVGRPLFLLIWGGVTLGAVVVWSLFLWRGQPPTAVRLAFIPARAARWITPLLLTLNGLCPYLGLKTESSFAMFSNLQTEDGQWNHVIIPQAFRVFHFQDELVTIVSSDDPELAQAARSETRYVWQNLRSIVHARPEMALAYVHAGKRHEARHARDIPELAEPPSWLAEKLLLFRSVPLPSGNVCAH